MSEFTAPTSWNDPTSPLPQPVERIMGDAGLSFGEKLLMIEALFAHDSDASAPARPRGVPASAPRVPAPPAPPPRQRRASAV